MRFIFQNAPIVVVGHLIICLSAIDSPCFAQTSTDLFNTNLTSQYFIAKSAYKKTAPFSLGRPDISQKYDLTDCAFSNPSIFASDLKVASASKLAADTTEIERTLNWLGYPPSIWRKKLSEYEKSQIEKLDNGVPYTQNSPVDFANNLNETLRDYRSRSNRKLAIAEWGPVCGAGRGGRFTVVTEPKGGNVSIISSFHYELCRGQRIDPDQPDKCSYWRIVHDGDETFFSGVYVYWARWPRGNPKRGREDFDQIPNSRTEWKVRQASR